MTLNDSNVAKQNAIVNYRAKHGNNIINPKTADPKEN